MKAQLQALLNKFVESVHHLINAAQAHIVALGTPKGLVVGVFAILLVVDVVMIGQMGFINYVLSIGANAVDLLIKGGWMVAAIAIAYFVTKK